MTGAGGPSWEEIVTRVAVAGDAVVLANTADGWERTFRGVGELATSLRVLAERTRHSWGGRPADAFSARLVDQARRLDAAVSAYGSVVHALRSCGTHLGAAVAAIPIPAEHVADVLERRGQFRQTGTLSDIPPDSFRPTTTPPEQAQAWVDEQHRRALLAYQRLRAEYARDLALFPTGAAAARAAHPMGEATAAPTAGSGTNTATQAGPTAQVPREGVPPPTVPAADLWAPLPVPTDDDHTAPPSPWSGGLAGVASIPAGTTSGGVGSPAAGLGPVVSPPILPGGPTAAGGALPGPLVATGQAAPAGQTTGARGAPLNAMYAMPAGGTGGPTPASSATGERLPLVDSDGTFLPPADAPYGVLNNP